MRLKTIMGPIMSVGIRIIYTMGLLALAGATTLHSQVLPTSLGLLPDSNRALEDRIDAIVQPYVDLGMFNGVILVAQGEDIRMLKPYGFADYGLGIPLRGDHRFRIASLSKQFTNAAVAALIEAGRLTPDSKVSDFLPDFPRGDEITIRHLVEHTSGIPHTNRLEELEHRTRIELEEMLDLLASKPLDFDPGTDARYSNGGYDLLAAIIERASGTSYEEFLAQAVYAPLGLHGTGRLRTYEVVRDLVRGYLPGKRPQSRGLPRFYPSELRIGGGSLYSTAEDVFHLFRSTFQREFASEETSDFLFWDRTRRYEITGRAPGFSAKVFIDIPNDITIVSLANNHAFLINWGRRLYQEVIEDGWATERFDVVDRRIPRSHAAYFEGRFVENGNEVSISVDDAGSLIYADLENDWSLAMIPLTGDRYLHPFFDVICRFEGDTRAESLVCKAALSSLDEGPTYRRAE